MVALSTVTLVAGVPPKVSDVASVKLVPVITTEVPPAITPVNGLNPVTEGTAALTSTAEVDPTEFKVNVAALPAASVMVLPPRVIALPTAMPSVST